MFVCAKPKIAGWFRQALVLLVIALVPAAISARWHSFNGASAEQATAGEITWDQARRESRFADVLWIDARPAPAFADGHMPGALRLTEAEWDGLLEPVIDVWRPGRVVVVYCDSHSCKASAGVAARLRRDLGTADVFVLQGGWQAVKR